MTEQQSTSKTKLIAENFRWTQLSQSAENYRKALWIRLNYIRRIWQNYAEKPENFLTSFRRFIAKSTWKICETELIWHTERVDFSMKISRIEAINHVLPSKLKVASYCRVSTTSDAQHESLEAQKTHYESFIKKNPKWEFAGIYFNFGITGTKADCRDGLQTMLHDCRSCFSANHCFTHIVCCRECGELFRRVHWKNRGKKSIVWRCISRLSKERSCHARTLNEVVLKSAFLEALNNIIADSQAYSSMLTETIASVLSSEGTAPENMDDKLEELQQQLLEHAGRHESYDDLAEEFFRLREEKEKTLTDETARKQYSESTWQTINTMIK